MATNILQYTIALKDMLSSKMRSIAAVSQKAIGDMERISKGYADTIKRGAGNVSQLQNALQRLQNGRNGIDAGTAAGIRHVRAYNSEIRRLEGNIRRLNTINGSRVKTWAADALNQLPGAGLMRNPLVMALTTGLFAGRAAMQADKTRTSMRTLVGERAGDQLYGELDKYARDTIWGKEVHDNAQTMLGFGISANKVMPYTRMLADVSMGDKNKLNSLTLAFSQIQAAGKLTGQDLLQLINAGFNPLGVISEKTGKSIGVLKKEMEDGAITADMVTAAFESATGPMGRYYQMTQKIANTPFGKFEALKGQLEGIAVKIGTALLPSISKALGMAAKFFDFLVNRGPDIVGVLGVVGAALVVTNMQAVGFAIGVKGAAVAATIMSSALVRLATAAATNPFVLAALGLSGLVILLRNAKKEMTALEKAKHSIANAQAEAAKTAETERIRLNELLKVSTDTELPLKRRKEAYDRLTKSIGEHGKALRFESDLAAKGKEAIEAYTKSLYKQAEARALQGLYQDAFKSYIDVRYSDDNEYQPNILARNVMNMSSLMGAIKDAFMSGDPGRLFPNYSINYQNQYAATQHRLRAAKENAAYSYMMRIKQLVGNEVVSAVDLDGGSDAFTGFGGTKGEGRKLSDAITGGGPRVININGVKFADTVNIHGTAGKSAGEHSEEYFSEMFLRVLQSSAKVSY